MSSFSIWSASLVGFSIGYFLSRKSERDKFEKLLENLFTALSKEDLGNLKKKIIKETKD